MHASRLGPGHGSVGGAIVLAGGAGRRLGGVDKPALRVGGGTLLERVLVAVGPVPTVVVGPPRSLPEGVFSAREEPPGSGPAAALAAGWAVLDEALATRTRDDQGTDGAAARDRALVAVLAADLPALTARTLRALAAAVPADGSADGAVLTDLEGRRQDLVGVWRRDALGGALAQRAEWVGAPLRAVFAPLRAVELVDERGAAADIDTPEDLRRWAGDSPECDAR